MLHGYKYGRDMPTATNSKEHDMCPPACASRCDTTLHRSVCEKHSVSIEPMDAMGWL